MRGEARRGFPDQQFAIGRPANFGATGDHVAHQHCVERIRAANTRIVSALSEREFPEPANFDLDREMKPHLAFHGGPTATLVHISRG